MLTTKLKQTASDDLNKVDKLIIPSLHSKVALVQDIGQYIVQNGGKRIRPLLLLICAKACGYHGQQQITMATVIEFIHTATLLHDDIVDSAILRRGQATANNKWGCASAVLVGDFLYSRAFQLMVKADNMAILDVIANATNVIAEGEVLQLLHKNNIAIEETDYLNVIRCKTSTLFAAATEIGALLANAEPHIQSVCAQYGLHLGTAYQLVDDVLDYQANAADFGKLLGNDLAEGKPTMPLIYLYKHGTEKQRAIIVDALHDPGSVDFHYIQQMILNSDAINYTLNFAKREANLAKQAIMELQNTAYRTAAIDLIDFIITREH